jgi:glyoxylase-like metal-dependent hydrolase (beta-lactamase superfamily II)
MTASDAPVDAQPPPRPPKQEQRPATTEVNEVAPGVLRTQLPINFTGLGHVNMYVLLDDRGAAVVDPGMPMRSSFGDVVDRLRRAGLRTKDVHTVVVTHSHPDHFGGAGRLADASGATIVTHARFHVPWLPDTAPDDIASVDDNVGRVSLGPGGLQVPWRASGDRIQPPGMPTKLPRPVGRLAWRVARRLFAHPTPGLRMHDGEHITLAGREWVAVHTPGHTADHLCLFDAEENLLLSGDHVLPTITPHISGLDMGGDPLRQYLDALARVGALGQDTHALPAHGDPFSDVPGRVAAISAHHDERLATLRTIANAIGPAPAQAYTADLFPRRHWGLMAESETFAHLEHLRLLGEMHIVKGDPALYALSAPN